ncbi:MAG: hypothetical protein Q9221_008343 [Calogaya cf. arnoldii]
MTAPYTCVRCRYRVTLLAQRTRARGFISLSQASSQPDPRQPDNAVQKSAFEQHGNAPHTKAYRRRNAVQRSSVGAGRTISETDSVLETLFTSNRKTTSAPARTRYSGTIITQADPKPEPKPKLELEPEPEPGSSKPPDQDDVRRLSQQFFEDKISLKDAWKNCERLLWTDTTRGRMAPRHDYMLGRTNKLFRDILMAINRRYLLSDTKDDLPSPHQVIHLYEERGVMRYWWNGVLWFQLAEILNTLQAFDAPHSIRGDLTSEKRTILIMEEIMNVWSEFKCRYGRVARLEINPNEVAVSSSVSNKDCFIALLPEHRHFHVADMTLAACKLTHQILKELTDIKGLVIPITNHGQAFVTVLDKLVEGRTFSLVAARKFLRQQGVEETIINRWLQYSKGWGKKPPVYGNALLPSEAPPPTQLPVARTTPGCEEDSSLPSVEPQEKHLSKSIPAVDRLSENDSGRSRDEASRRRAATTIIKDLERAVDRFDVARVAGIWQEYQRTLAIQEIEQQSREEIFIHFLTSFFALSNQEQAVHVWNDMIQCGIAPNQKHWNAMLHGASKARDVTSLDEIWNGMLATGIEPDLVSWTTYINGLIMCKKYRRGLQALNDLGGIWRQTIKDQRASGVPQDGFAMEIHTTLTKYNAHQPSLAPIQAAIGALLRARKEELCWPLLEWAKSFSIPLTTGLFNVILRYAVRQGDSQLINHTFSLMDANKCSADEQTYTILLNGHMSNIDSTFPDLSLEEQQISVLRILDDMTAKNVPVDQHTYGTILYGLLNPKNEKRNDHAARAVLDHMNRHNVKPSHYTYSILVTHYFSLPPPDLQAVETLWKRIKIERPILDREFYEKMVEGYAASRLVERMLYFLRRIPHEGKSPTWGCLSVVFNTLIDVGEWGHVKELITDVKDRKSGLRRFADEGWKRGKQEREFWFTVDNIKHRTEELG